MRYLYTHTDTQATTGYFTCTPETPLSIAEALAYLADHPYDDFMRKDLLARINPAAPLPEDQKLPYPARLALLAESRLLQALADKTPFPPAGEDLSTLTRESSLTYLRWLMIPDRERQQPWLDFFTANQKAHRTAKAPTETGLPPLYNSNDSAADTNDSAGTPGSAPVFSAPFPFSLTQMHAHCRALPHAPESIPEARETAALAEERLQRLGIIAGQEMRHTASLSPIALLRPWNIRLQVNQGRHNYSLQGQATTYGRGLSIDKARVSCLMEMVERASAYLSINNGQVLDRTHELALYPARRSELLCQGLQAIDPNDFPIETPYADETLNWVQGYSFTDHGARLPVYVPIQMAGLFCNLDEISLYDAPGSTGIATGPTEEWAMRAALLEIIERDAEATTPYSKNACFTLAADPANGPEDALVHALLADYTARGINVQFQDMTGELGVPVYKCFVLTRKGEVSAGFGASLAARNAVLSALTETPYPYPQGGPSGPTLRKLPQITLHSLPDFSLGSAKAEFHMLDALLRKNHRPPVYVNLTRTGLDFPVVRTLVPGMELAADRDTFSRVPRRLYKNYREL